jgi:drug/metabolite transporter (DMT)-like permease
MLGLPYALAVWAEGRVSPGVVPLCFALMPLAALLLDGGDGSGDGPGGAIPGVVLGIGGVAMVVAPGISFPWQDAGGVAALLMATALGAFSLIYARRIYTRKVYAGGRFWSGDIFLSCTIQFGVAAVLLAVLQVSTGRGSALHWQTTAALPLALLAIVVSGGTLPWLYWLVGRVPAWQAATLQWVSTLVAVIEAAVLVRARPAIEGWMGMALVPACILWIFLQANSGPAEPLTPEITKHTFSQARASDTGGKTE